MDAWSDVLWTLAVVGILILANSFFVAAEYALVRVRRTRMEALAVGGNRNATVVLHGLLHINRYVAGIQVGVTLAGLAAGRFGQPAMAELLEPVFEVLLPRFLVGAAARDGIVTGLTLVTITYLLVVVGELVPKAMTLQFPDRVALLLARPLRIIVGVFRPLIWSMNGLGRVILRGLGIPMAGEASQAPSVEELKLLIVQSHRAGILEDIERRLAHSVFRFADLRAVDVMIPRPDIVAFDAHMPVDTLLDRAAQTIHARFPVYEGTIDRVVGILHLQDLFRHLRQSADPIDVRRLLRPVLAVPESIRMDDLLGQLRRRQTQIAVVVDEHGGTNGLVTLEDVVEEVFGEFRSTSPTERHDIWALPDGRVMIRGEVRLARLHDERGWTFGDTDAETIAGYVMERLGRVARVGDVLASAYGDIRVEHMAGLRVTEVSVLPPTVTGG